MQGFQTQGTISTSQRKQQVSIVLDTYAEMDFVSHNLVQELGLQPYVWKKHLHIIPEVQTIGLLTPKTYRVYHLKLSITDRHNRLIDFIRPFVAIDQSATDSPILLGRPSLQSLAIVLDNETGEWEFKRHARIQSLTAHTFA